MAKEKDQEREIMGYIAKSIVNQLGKEGLAQALNGVGGPCMACKGILGRHSADCSFVDAASKYI